MVTETKMISVIENIMVDKNGKKKVIEVDENGNLMALNSDG